MPPTDVTSLQRRLREWALQPSTERNFCRGPQQMLESALQDPRRTTQASISGYLLGTWHLGCGELAVLQGDMVGWDRIRLGVALQRTSLWLRAVEFAERRGGPDLPALQTANCAALVLAFDDPDPMGERLLSAFADMPDDRFAETAVWPLFVRELLTLRQRGRPVAGPRLGPYSEALQAFGGNEQLLARKLQELCDLHLSCTRGTPGAAADFDEPGVMLLPLAVLAVRAVRRSLDLPTPKVEHPMMFTNLVQTAPAGAWPEDPWLARLLERANRRPRR